MDGVLWRGEGALSGLEEFFEHVRRRRLPIVLATNNSSKSAAEYVKKLRRFGIDGIAQDQVVTSRTVLIDYLATHYATGTAIYVIGSPNMKVAIADAGYAVTDTASVVAVGIDVELTYDKLKQAALLIGQGADFLATNGDVSIPSVEGLVPGNGAIVAALQAATGRDPLVMGKPALPIFQTALRRLGSAANRTLMLGDRLDTDISGARAAGLKSVLLLTGATKLESAMMEDAKPDAVFSGLPELLAAWS